MTLHLLKPRDKRLRQKCAEVVFPDPTVREIIPDMLAKCREWEGYALAAPQVGIMKRFFVVADHPRLKRHSSPRIGSTLLAADYAQEYSVFINPWIQPIFDATATEEEGCLSLPGMFKPVKRLIEVVVHCYDEFGVPRSLWASDLMARVIQHECDHLDGRLIGP